MQSVGGDSASASDLENDTTRYTALAPFTPLYWSGAAIDLTPFYGRVAFVNGPTVDQPVEAIRLAYGFRDVTRVGSPYLGWDSVAWVPTYDVHARAANGSLTSGWASTGFVNGSGTPEIVGPPWNADFNQWHGLGLAAGNWWGTVFEDKRNGSGQLYRRNRYYDPITGRFTQEDPAGLAGGINSYGFANGDPVNFSDPFGLACLILGNCTQSDVSATHLAAGAVLSGAGLTASTQSEIPATFARVVPGNSALPTLAHPGDANAFVTNATAVRGLSAEQISATLGIRLGPSGYKVIEFPSSSVSNIASPINRTNPGFVGRGQTIGGAPEYVVPNGPIPEGAITTEVPIRIEIPIEPIP